MWDTSQRRDELPDDWQAIRSQVLREAKGLCEIRRPGCTHRATEVDHKNRGNDHRRENLRAACRKCHGWKSSQEGVAQRKKLQAQRKRPPERHPGTR